ncbi:MAG: cyclic nucleotide-binding domain-containing protein [Elusimicrobia bacterium]|jgi:CRP-like cAMP-binding protein|nr:cyclic nucleotide-binding domain-containing protein [Elusimicrobiota bacterium]
MGEKLGRDDQTLAMLREAFRLAGFSPEIEVEDVPKLLPNSGFFAYAPDEHIIEQDEAGKDLYILCSGQVLITKTFGSAGVTLAVLEPGAVFGEMALLRDGIRVATVAAGADCRVFRVAARDMESVLTSHPRLGTMLQELAAKRT